MNYALTRFLEFISTFISAFKRVNFTIVLAYLTWNSVERRKTPSILKGFFLSKFIFRNGKWKYSQQLITNNNFNQIILKFVWHSSPTFFIVFLLHGQLVTGPLAYKNNIDMHCYIVFSTVMCHILNSLMYTDITGILMLNVYVHSQL